MVVAVEGQCHLARRDQFQTALQRQKRSGPFRSTQEADDSVYERTSVEVGQRSEESGGCTRLRRNLAKRQ